MSATGRNLFLRPLSSVIRQGTFGVAEYRAYTVGRDRIFIGFGRGVDYTDWLGKPAKPAHFRDEVRWWDAIPAGHAQVADRCSPVRNSLTIAA